LKVALKTLGKPFGEIPSFSSIKVESNPSKPFPGSSLDMKNGLINPGTLKGVIFVIQKSFLDLT